MKKFNRNKYTSDKCLDPQFLEINFFASLNLEAKDEGIQKS